MRVKGQTAQIKPRFITGTQGSNTSSNIYYIKIDQLASQCFHCRKQLMKTAQACIAASYWALKTHLMAEGIQKTPVEFCRKLEMGHQQCITPLQFLLPQHKLSAERLQNLCLSRSHSTQYVPREVTKTAEGSCSSFCRRRYSRIMTALDLPEYL